MDGNKEGYSLPKKQMVQVEIQASPALPHCVQVSTQFHSTWFVSDDVIIQGKTEAQHRSPTQDKL